MENRSCEKLSIKNSIVSLKKYGSTSKRLPNVTLVKHIIQDADTLQGIALKYGVSMEQIRRANRLWASDSLFLRKHLAIPVTDTAAAPTDNATSNASKENEVIATSPSCDIDPTDFLSKIDASIASTKEEYRKTQHNSRYSPHYSAGHKQSNNNNQSSYQNYTDTSTMSSMTPRNSKLRASLQRLEQKQDELFEL